MLASDLTLPVPGLQENQRLLAKPPVHGIFFWQAELPKTWEGLH